MCLAVPGEIVRIMDDQAEVDFSGARRTVSLRLTPEAKVGEFVLVHAGCAIQIVPADEARETIKLFDEVFGENDHE